MAIRNGGFLDVAEDQLTNRIYVDGWDADAKKGSPRWQTETLAGHNFLDALKEGGLALADHQDVAPGGEPRVTRSGVLLPVPRNDFFERVIVVPLRINAGLVLSTKVFDIHVYNAHELQQRTLSTIVNNLGAGTALLGVPSLPRTIEEQDGFTFQLQISAQGPASISGTIVLTFDTVTITITVTGSRSFVFPFEPETPMIERLGFLTDVMRKRDGKEQRFALRDNPRQIFEMRILADGRDRAALQAFLFDAQGRSIGIPTWFEPTPLTVAASIGNQTITVESTSFADLRVGGLAVIWNTPHDFEALEIQSMTSTTITFTTTLTRAFAAGARVMPVRVAFVQGSVASAKWPRNLEEFRMRVVCSDNQASLGSATPFPTFNGKVYLNDPNAMEDRTSEEHDREVTIVDGETGSFLGFTDVAVNRRASAKRFVTRSRQRLWEIRQLLHFLRGSRTSFYLPTFFDDLKLTQNLTSGTTVAIVENIGYTKFVGARQPWNAVRVRKKDGTEVTRTIVSSSELSEAEEQITVNAAWGIDVTIADLDLMSFVEEVRVVGDEIEIRHEVATGQATVVVPVISVLE